MFTTNDFQNYRSKLGFKNREEFKKFLSAKDIIPSIDYNYIDLLNNRLQKIFISLNAIYYKPCECLDGFFVQHLLKPYNIIKSNIIIIILTNKGRRKDKEYLN